MNGPRGSGKDRIHMEIGHDSITVRNYTRHLVENVRVDPWIVEAWTRVRYFEERRAELEPATKASASFDRLLAFVPARVVPRRIQSEVVGDGIERIGAVIRGGGSKWLVRLVYASVVLTVVGEIIRYWARAIKGERARK